MWTAIDKFDLPCSCIFLTQKPKLADIGLSIYRTEKTSFTYCSCSILTNVSVAFSYTQKVNKNITIFRVCSLEVVFYRYFIYIIYVNILLLRLIVSYSNYAPVTKL